MHPWQLGGIFPLPPVADEAAPRAGLSRGVEQGVRRRIRYARDVNQNVGALNFLAGARGGDRVVQPVRSPTAGQRDVWGDIAEGHALYASAPVLVPGEAARALLKGRSGYGPDGSTVRSFNKDQVALPDMAAESPFERDVLPGPGRELLERLVDHSWRSEEELKEMAEVRPYVDPVLKNNWGVYLSFLKEFRRRS